MKRKNEPVVSVDRADAESPFNYLRAPLTMDNQDVTTALMLAGEALAEPFRSASPYPAPEFAISEGEAENNFDWLLEIVGVIRQKLQEDPRRAELPTEAIAALGDDGVRLLFRNLFPMERTPPHLDENGKSLLSQAEMDILREAAGDRSHEEIAVRLRIAKRTVSTHFTHIYRKLGVKSPIKAVARAIAMGYLDMDAFDIIGAASGCTMRDFSALHYIIACTANSGETLKQTDMKTLAGFGVLLVAACDMSAIPIAENQRFSLSAPRGLLCEISREGKILRSFGSERLRDTQSIAMAPPASAQYGFTPGNLFAVCDSGAARGLNRSVITEFTPQGEFVRAFTGGRSIGTRLDNARRIRFTASGQLLATSNNNLLRFTRGGRRIEVLVGGCCLDVCEDSDGHLYVLHHSTLGSRIGVYDANGLPLRDFGGTEAGSSYFSLALLGDNVLAICNSAKGDDVKTFAPQGDYRSEFSLIGYGRELFTGNADRLFVPCRRFGDIQVFSHDGNLLRRLDLSGIISPYCVIFGAAGNLWVCGAAL